MSTSYRRKASFVPDRETSSKPLPHRRGFFLCARNTQIIYILREGPKCCTIGSINTQDVVSWRLRKTIKEIKMAERRGGKRPNAGRPKGKVSEAKRAIAEAAQDHAGDMLKVLVQIAKDKKEPASARVAAANSVIERGYGKPITPVQNESQDRLTAAILEINCRGSAAPIKTARPAED